MELGLAESMVRILIDLQTRTLSILAVSATFAVALSSELATGSSPKISLQQEIRDDFFGTSVVALGDVNADGVPEFAIGDPADNEKQLGCIWVVSGPSAELLYRVTDPSSSFGEEIAGGADLNEDGCPDFVASIRSETGEVLVRAIDGKTGEKLWAGKDAKAPRHGFSNVLDENGDTRPIERLSFRTTNGPSIVLVPDVDGGGVSDIVIACTGESDDGTSFVACLSGETGEMVWENCYDAKLGYSLVRAGDLNGDGIEEVVLGSPDWMNLGGIAAGGQVLALSSIDGSLLWRVEGPNKERFFGNSVAAFDDQDGDGIFDVLVGSAFVYDRTDAVDVLSGATGKWIRRLTLKRPVEGRWYETDEGMYNFGSGLVGANGVVYCTSLALSGEAYIFTSDGRSQFESADTWAWDPPAARLFNLGDLSGNGRDELAGTATDLVGSFGSYVNVLRTGESGSCFAGTRIDREGLLKQLRRLANSKR